MVLQGADPENDIVRPAVQGSLSMLNSAAKVPSVRRIVITSSVAGLASDSVLANGDTFSVSRSGGKRVNLFNDTFFPLASPIPRHSSIPRLHRFLCKPASYLE
jgi:hypothetical protein